MWPNYAFHVPEQKKLRYIVHTDCKNEADDQFTLAHILMTDKLDVRGIIAGHFDKGNHGRYPEHQTAQASLDEVNKILELMDLTGKYPVFKGAEVGIPDESTPVVTDAARFIVEEAMRDDPRPLYIGMQGAITDLACAILMEPRICERMTCIWIGGADYGSRFADDQFQEVLQKMKAADTIVIGSPVYWHNICGSVRNLLDRFYGPVEEGELAGRKLVFLFQGAAPEKWMLDAGEYTISRFARLYGLDYLGMAVTQKDSNSLAKVL